MYNIAIDVSCNANHVDGQILYANQCVNEDVYSHVHNESASDIGFTQNAAEPHAFGQLSHLPDSVGSPTLFVSADDIVAPMASTCVTPYIPKRTTTESIHTACMYLQQNYIG